MSRKTKRPPTAWAWRRGWRRLVALAKGRLAAARKARASKPKRRGTNPRQPRSSSCRQYVRQLCVQLPDPCGVCPRCCPGHTKPPAEQDGGRFTTSVEKA
jgi:hypothetical protein